MNTEHDATVELETAVDKIVQSTSRKKLIVAGPGTGKTTIFRKLLENTNGQRDTRLVLTFIRALAGDLEGALGTLARVSTLHGYCQSLLRRAQGLRGGLTSDFRCVPGMASLIADDWKLLRNAAAPAFVKAMRSLDQSEELGFYFDRANYYDAVDFDDSVYRVTQALRADRSAVESLDLVLVDEFQDFNAMEAAFIDAMGSKNPIVIAGDDDQALYSQLRGASWDYIRMLHSGEEYEKFELPFCMRCPEVVVGAVADVIDSARKRSKLEGRIDKPYRHFAPKKGSDSQRYPKILCIESSVQSAKSNYLGKYIARAIQDIRPEEIAESVEGKEPTVLIIGPKHYLDPIETCLVAAGFAVERRREKPERAERAKGLEILGEDPEANIGWRIVVGDEARHVLLPLLQESTKGAALAQLISKDLRVSVLAEAAEAKARISAEDQGDAGNQDAKAPTIRMTSFEGSKGMSAQHVFIVGLQDGVLPRQRLAIDDLEICRFLVGLTRTKKLCTLMWPERFAGKKVTRSVFVEWIGRERRKHTRVDAKYWKR